MSAKQTVLLVQDVPKLGKSGELCDVSGGYARNFLIPKAKAVFADKGTFRLKETLQAKRALQTQKDLEEAQALAASLKDVVLKKVVKVDEQGHMYGSVSQIDIVALFKEKGFEIAKNNIVMKAPFKQVGTFDVTISLKEEVTTKVQLEISSEEHSTGAVVADEEQSEA